MVSSCDEKWLKLNQLEEVSLSGASLSTTNYVVTLSGKKKSPKLAHLIECFKNSEGKEYKEKYQV